MRKCTSRENGAKNCDLSKAKQITGQEACTLSQGKITSQIEYRMEAEAGDTSPNHSPESTLAIIEGVLRVAEASTQKAEFAATATATEAVSDLVEEALPAHQKKSPVAASNSEEEATFAQSEKTVAMPPHEKPRSADAAETVGSGASLAGAKLFEDSAGGTLQLASAMGVAEISEVTTIAATASDTAEEAPFAQPKKTVAASLPAPSKAFRVSVGYATAAAEEICGDTAISSGLPDGSLALILSDGMGKGIRAAALSRSVANRLRKNLKAGMAPAKAIKEVNAYTVSHSESENFATVDLLMIDRRTQKAKFYKMGAASSFVFHEGRVRMFEQAALPIGIIPRIRLAHISSQLKNGDIVIMVSDGITEAGRKSDDIVAEAATNCDIDGSWLRELLENRATEELTGASPRKLAQWILAETVKQYGESERDDLAVAVVKVLTQ